ncbi:MAG: UxaA family hydrolase [Candidatus Heteroscillospira sp.]|jgi:altronate dehydratase large subunit
MTFKGYLRPDGKVGIRNKVLILPTCNCSSETAQRISALVEGTVSFVNQNGCSQTQDDVKYTSDVLAGFAANPNVYGVVVVGNGCEVLGADRVIDAIRRRDAHKPVYRVVIQEEGGTPGAIEKGCECARKLAEEASLLKAEDFDISKLIIATECGGSDATSGIAANPVVGAMSDRVIAAGGTVILSETTEFMGAEHILARRAASSEIGQRILDCVERYESYLKSLHTDLRGTNPAPGNKKGGITTLEEKSLGCIYKGGSSTINGVFEYAEPVTGHGLVIMDTPGADSASLCGMAAGGAQIAVFTTGRGTPIGNPIMPVVKVTGNAETARKMAANMDFDASGVFVADDTIEELGEKLTGLILEVANGRRTKAELYNMNEVGFSRLCNYV